MINLLTKLIGYQSPIQEQKEDWNKFFEAFYGQFNFNGTVTWMDDKSQTFIDEGYRGNAMIYSVVNKIMMKDSEPVLQAFKDVPDRKKKFNRATKYKNSPLAQAEAKLYLKKELELVEKGDLIDLLSNPNKHQTQYSFLQDVSMYWRMTGEFFIYGIPIGSGRDARKFSQLYVLPSHLVEIVQGDMFQPVLGYKFKIGQQMVYIEAENVLHVKTPNPTWNLQGSQLRGQSALLAGLKYLQKNNEAVTSLYSAMQNEGAKGFVSPDMANPEFWFTSEQLYTLKDQIKAGWEGAKNKNSVRSAGIPLKYTQIGKSPVELDTLKGLDYDFKIFCNLWGVNPAIFSDDPKYDNMLEAKKSLVTDVCMPFLNQLEQELYKWLKPRYPGECDTLEFDTTIYSELQPDVKMILDTYGKSPAFTWNEVRIMLDWEEIEGEEGNIHWVPTNLIPAQDAILGNINPDFVDFNQ